MEIFVEFDISIENAFQASYVPLTSFSGKGIKEKRRKSSFTFCAVNQQRKFLSLIQETSDNTSFFLRCNKKQLVLSSHSTFNLIM